MRSDRGHLTAYQIGCEVGQSVVLVLRAILDRHILALDVAGFTKALPECGQIACTINKRRAAKRGTRAEHADHRHRRLLRARRERPRGRATEQCNEFAPPHGAYPKAKGRELIIAPCIAAKRGHSSRVMGWSGRAPAPASKRSWPGGTKVKEHAMSQKLNSAIAVIGIDIGKNSFHVVGHDRRGAIVLRQKWSRGQVETRLANLPPCLVGMEACVGAHHLSRKLQLL